MTEETPVRNRRGQPTAMTRRIGEIIRSRRRELDWNQEELATKIGVSRDSVSRYEAGLTEINASDMPKIAEVLGVPIEYFYYGQIPLANMVVMGKVMHYGVAGATSLKSAERQTIEVGPVQRTLLEYFDALPEQLQTVMLAQARALVELTMSPQPPSKQKSDEEDTLVKTG